MDKSWKIIKNGVAQLKLKKAVSVDLGHIIFIYFY